MKTNKVCSFFGHRKIDITDELKLKVKDVVENLIIKNNVTIFLFGSRSEFNKLCHFVVTKLKEKYPHIKRVAYTCKSETCTLESERAEKEKTYSKYYKKQITLLGVEEECEHKSKYTSGKASYVERNFEMINNSDFCVFYYNKEYKPPMLKYSKKSISFYQPKSGTNLAYEYAKQKKKNIINVFLS